MMKLFRKYNKQLLAVFMTLLMVVFIGGSAFENLVRPRYNRLVAESKLGPIRSEDQRRTDYSTNILTRLGLNWQYPERGIARPVGLLEWTILNREARQMGLAITLDTVRARMAEEPGVSQIIQAVANDYRMKPQDVYDAVAQLHTIQLAAHAIGEAAHPSAAELRSVAQRVLDKVQVRAVVIPAAAFLLENQQFTPEAVEEHWKKYRDVEPGGGLNFGYFQPLSLRAQYLMIDPEVIALQIRVPDLERKSKQYFEKNKESDPRFRKPAPPPAAEGETQPAEASPFMTYEEAAALAENAVKGEHAREAAERIANWLVRTAQDRLAMVPRTQGNYREIPADIQAPGWYLELIQRLPREISYAEAVTVGTTEFFQHGNAGATPIIGRATYRPDAGLWKSFTTLAFRSQPVVPTIPEEPKEDRGDYIALGETSPYYLTDAAGRLFVFRIVEVKPPHPAESIDEVREAVLRDMRLQDAFHVAREHGEDLLHQASEGSLESAFEQHESLKALKEKPEGAISGLFTPPPLARMNRYDVGTGKRSPIQAGWGVGTLPPEIVAEWFDLEYAVQPRAVQDLKERATVLVVEWVETQRATLADFEGIRQQLLNELISSRRRELVSRWFDPDNVRARNGVQVAGS